MQRWIKFTIVVLTSLLGLTAGMAANIRISDYAQQHWTHWQHKVFQGETQYQFVKEGKSIVVMAHAQASASGMVKKIKVDLKQTPIMHWRWKVNQLPYNAQERQRQGDDFVARIYVVKSGGWFFWRTYAINYVWSSQQKVGSWWPSPYTDHAILVSMQSGNKNTGKWIEHKRNIKQDMQRFLGKDISHIDAVAIMTDMDNTGQTATAFYGDIYFSDQ